MIYVQKVKHNLAEQYIRNLPSGQGFFSVLGNYQTRILIQKYYFKREISNFIIYRQTLAF